MKSLLVLAVALFPAAAFAQTANTPIQLTDFDGAPVRTITAALVQPDYCKPPNPGGSTAGGFGCDRRGNNLISPLYVDLAQFARKDDLAAASSQLTNNYRSELAIASAQLTASYQAELANASALLTTAFQDRLDRAADRADEGAAMAGALDFIPPTDGAANRIGAQAFTMGDRAAVGVSYTRAAGRLDLGIGLATSGNRSAAKVGIGLSW